MTAQHGRTIHMYVRPPAPNNGFSDLTPRYATEGSAAMDLKAAISEPYQLDPGGYVTIGTGVYVEVPPGYCIDLLPRSGWAAKYGITLANSPGLIDSDYRGEIMVALQRRFDVLSAAGVNTPVIINPGDRICQMRLIPVYTILPMMVDDSDELSSTARGPGGFGSTGVAAIGEAVEIKMPTPVLPVVAFEMRGDWNVLKAGDVVYAYRGADNGIASFASISLAQPCTTVVRSAAQAATGAVPSELIAVPQRLLVPLNRSQNLPAADHP